MPKLRDLATINLVAASTYCACAPKVNADVPRDCVALATDSAVTIDGSRNRKTYNTVNKLFTLSKYAPVGIMFYGNAELMDVPWEVIVKIYRHRLGTKTFPLLDDYAADFLDFLKAASDLFPPGQQQRYLEIRLIHSIYGNATDLRYNNGGGATVMAQNNWWGLSGGSFVGSIDRSNPLASDPNLP